MHLSQTKKAIEGRRRRVNDREKRRRTVFVHDYVRTKYTEIYGECNMFYYSLLEKYPGKLDLTKTKDYKKWKGQLIDGRQNETDMTGSVQPIHSETDMSESVNPVRPEMDMPESVNPVHLESDMSETAQAIHPETDMTESVNPVHPETDMPEPASILEVATQELFSSVPVDIENMDRIVNEIIAELEQDEQIRDLLPYVQSDVEEDEGIELNIETELAAIVEPFDYQLEVEWAEW